MITDPGGRTRSSWRTHRLCLENVPETATHLLVLQDDCQPCDGFAQLVHAAIEERPDRIICLFIPGVGHLTRRVNIARNRGDRWLEFPSITFVPLVAVIYPAAIAQAIPEFADARRINVGRADDAVVSTYCRAHHVTAVATLPCLVEHLDAAPSVMRMPSGNGHPHRLAAWFEQAASGSIS